MTTMWSAGSPCSTVVSPSSKSRTVIWEASQAKPSTGRSANVGTDCNSSTEGEGAAARRLARVSMSDFAQVLVYKLDGYGAFAHSGSNALDRAMADVANREDARNIGFEHARLASERPAFRPFPLGKQIPSGENEPALVALDEGIQPSSAWLGADKDEQRGGWFAPCVAGCVTGDGDRFEMILAVHFENTR